MLITIHAILKYILSFMRKYTAAINENKKKKKNLEISKYVMYLWK